MLQHRAFRYRIYPSKEQQNLIHKMFGCSRFIFNHFLEKWNTAFQETGKGLSYKTCAKGLPTLKKDFPWLTEVDSIALQSSVRHLVDAFTRFFRKQNEVPRFKSRKNPVQSYTTKYTNDNIAVKDNWLKLPKLGWLRFAKSRELEGRILSATIRRNGTGKYFVSIHCEVEIHPLPQTEQSIGIDLGLKTFAVCSDGEEFPNPNYLRKYEKQLTRWQRILSRRTIGGSNWCKAKQKVARIHEKIANSRKDHLHQISTRLIRENQTICLEDLQVTNLMKNHRLAKSIADVSWRMFRSFLEYKTRWYGRNISIVPRNYPSSQLCSHCDHTNPEVKDLSIREWICPHCNTHHERDKNASKNIHKKGLQLLTV